ncbi:hypothetical protein AQUCO_01400543v1 [Aquilegia coerulea]|uniref:CID domain-containing protein n=1 Tax=Aquilegia coerulea TaxID=218851 RepID=A0A2G5DWZ0_AQUCA|nr:hypothetical protein AQUCO_01400543v1 [Aquilegia coerulea]PIA48018.1 hypothetical protein AQUCO_01400543v1 [Aquilegia coerulea]
MNSAFSEQILADKLTKLNSTQQCIETLSHWCIFHQSKAEEVVSTWDKQFHSSQMTQKIPFLYLANDILQNSKRKGNEFVSEFWKVLPAAVKDILENGDDHGKNVASRLVNIWEERRVFGSRAHGLKDIMLGKELVPPLELSKKRSRSVKIIKRDSRSIRIKLTTGGTTEKIVSAFHAVLNEHSNEDLLMNKCKSSVHHVRKMEKEVDTACTKEEDPKRTTLANELEEQETVLKQCIEKLKSVEATREALVAQLKEALHEQESELENVRTQIQVAQAQAGESCNMRKRLNNETDVSVPDPSSTATTPPLDSNSKGGETPRRTAAAIAAEVADKLAASTKSQQIMSSVLSSFAAQEAKSAGATSASTPPTSFAVASTNSSSTQMRSNLEKPLTVMDSNTYITAQPVAIPASNSYQTVLIHQLPIQGPTSNTQPQYHLLTNTPSQQYIQQNGGIITGMPYGYSNVPPPPQPSGPPPHMNMPAQFTQQQSMIQQPPAPPSFRPLQPPGMLYYTHPHQNH